MDADGGRGPRADQTERSASTALDHLVTSNVDVEPLLETIAESALECFVVVDEQARTLFVDRAVEDLLGYEPSALVGERLTEVIPPEYRERYLTAFAEYLRTGERTLDWDHVEFPGLQRDGSEMPLLIVLREFERDDHRYLVAIMRDAAQRAEQRDRMASEQAFVDSVLDAVPDVVYAFDESGQFLRWNESAKEITGYTDEEIASMEPLAFIPERDHRRVTASLNRVFTDGAVETIESALVTKDGSEIPYEFTGPR